MIFYNSFPNELLIGIFLIWRGFPIPKYRLDQLLEPCHKKRRYRIGINTTLMVFVFIPPFSLVKKFKRGQPHFSQNSRWDALRHLVPFVQLKKREKHPWRSVSFSTVSGSNVCDMHASKCKIAWKITTIELLERNIRDNNFHTQQTFEQVHRAIIWWVPDNREETANP